MKKRNNNFWLLMSLLAFSVAFVSCGDDDEDPPVDPTLVSLTAGGIDLNGASSPTDVPQDATIVATFASAIDAATANSSTITMVRNYDDTDVPVTVTTSGSTVTVTPTGLISGAQYTLSFGSGIMSTQGEDVAAFTRTFTTEGSFTPEGQVAYWNFEGDATDQVGSYDAAAEVDIVYEDSHNANAGQAATFNGNTSIIEVPNGDNLMNTDEFTLSFWVKTNSEGHVNAVGDPAGHFVMGLGAFYGFQFEIPADYGFLKIPVWIELSDGTTRGGGDLFWNGDGMTRDNGGWQGTTFNDEEDISTIAKDQWMHVAFVFNGTEKTRAMYVNGDMRIRHDYNLWPDDATEKLVTGMMWGGTEPEVLPELAFGFVHSRGGTLWDAEPWGGYDNETANHFKGQLDDIRIFHEALTEQEVELMYNSENQ